MKRLNFFYKIYLWVATFIGVILRIVWVINIPCIPVSDFAIYQRIATNVYMNKGNSYMGKPVAFQAPGYTVALGYFYKLFSNNSVILGKLFNIILSSLTLLIMLFIILKLFNNIKVILLSYTLIVLDINYIAYNNVLGSEIVFTFLFALIILLELSNIEMVKKYIFIGCILALSALTKPNFLIYIFVILLIEWLKDKNIKVNIKKFFIALSAFIIVIVPWTYRNFKVYNQLIPVSYNGGYVLFINNNDNNTTGAWMPISQIHMSEGTLNELNKVGFRNTKSVDFEVQQAILMPKLQKIFFREAEKWILRHPIKFFKLGILRIRNTFFSGASDVYTWAVSKYGTNNLIYLIVNSYFFKQLNYLTINVLSISGFLYLLVNIKSIFKGIFSRKFKVDYIVSLPAINIIFFIIITFVFEGQARYNFPILFIFVICFSDLIAKLKSKLLLLYKELYGENGVN